MGFLRAEDGRCPVNGHTLWLCWEQASTVRLYALWFWVKAGHPGAPKRNHETSILCPRNEYPKNGKLHKLRFDPLEPFQLQSDSTETNQPLTPAQSLRRRPCHFPSTWRSRPTFTGMSHRAITEMNHLGLPTRWLIRLKIHPWDILSILRRIFSNRNFQFRNSTWNPTSAGSVATTSGFALESQQNRTWLERLILLLYDMVWQWWEIPT